MAKPIILIGFNPWSRPYLREMTLGIRRFADQHTDWQLIPTTLIGFPGGHPSTEAAAQGLITDVPAPDREHILGWDIPRIVVGAGGLTVDLPWVGPDYSAVAETALDYMLNRGYRSVAFFRNANPKREDVNRIEQALRELADQRGMPIPVFGIGPRTQRRGRWDYHDQLADVADFIQAQPAPLGLICSDDPHAWRAAEACRQSGIDVPKRVAILGIGNDPFTCEFAHPPLSSIAIDYRQIGYTAANMLKLAMEGRPVRRMTCDGRAEVIMRRSTEHVTSTDREVAEALRFISEHLAENLSVERLAETVMLSRRTLLRRFQAALGRSPAEEIRRRRIEEAKRLIRDTEMPLSRVAVETGFGQQPALGRAIKADTGRTPAQLRREAAR